MTKVFTTRSNIDILIPISIYNKIVDKKVYVYNKNVVYTDDDGRRLHLCTLLLKNQNNKIYHKNRNYLDFTESNCVELTARQFKIRLEFDRCKEAGKMYGIVHNKSSDTYRACVRYKDNGHGTTVNGGTFKNKLSAYIVEVYTLMSVYGEIMFDTDLLNEGITIDNIQYKSNLLIENESISPSKTRSIGIAHAHRLNGSFSQLLGVTCNKGKWLTRVWTEDGSLQYSRFHTENEAGMAYNIIIDTLDNESTLYKHNDFAELSVKEYDTLYKKVLNILSMTSRDAHSYSSQGNNYHGHKSKTSIYTGVCQKKTNSPTFQCVVYKNRKRVVRLTFKTEEGAAEEYNNSVLRYYGKEAKVNFIKGHPEYGIAGRYNYIKRGLL